MTRTWGEQWRAIEVLSLASLQYPGYGPLRAAVSAKAPTIGTFPLCLAQVAVSAQGLWALADLLALCAFPATVLRDDWS